MPSLPTSTASRTSTASNGRARRRDAGAGRKNKKKPEGWRETLRFWGTTLILVLVIRAFFFEAFRIPTPSMEKSLLVGDFLFVSKLHYGARTPATLGIPFTRIYWEGIELPQVRLPGFDDPDRGDVAVFNYPPEDEAVERKTPYIKRLVGMPGDTLALIDKVLTVNGEPFPLSEHMQQQWALTPSQSAGFPVARLNELGAPILGELRPEGNGPIRWVINTTPAVAEEVRSWPYVEKLEPFVIPQSITTGSMFPQTASYNRDHYGPIYIPEEGATVAVTAATWPLYREVITRYEGHRASMQDGVFVLEGQPAETYTFEQDYYFAMGDNRDDSADSRFWGFVPENHLVGKAVVVFFSIDFDRFLPRLTRTLHPIR